MAMQAVATAGGGISKWGALKAILGKVPFAFAFIFVAFMLVATLSDAWNRYEETKNLGDLAIGVGKSVVKPIIASDAAIFSNVQAFNAGNLLWYQKIMLWLTTMGAISTIYFCYKWLILKFVKTLFPDGMNSELAIHFMSFYIIFSLATIYNTASSGHLMVGGEGLWALFRNFSIVFEPVLMIGEPILRAFNMLPDANVPIFVS